MNYIKVNNWEELQHYKDRTPPWIKLHRTLLTDYQFSCLQDASKLHLMLIWLYASQCDNKIPNDPQYLQRVLQIEEAPNLKELIDKGFLFVEQDASAMLADSKQSARLEEERREEICASDDCANKPSQFDAFWEIYPFKKDRKKAETAFNRLSKKKQQEAIAGIKPFFASQKEDYYLYPTTYIHGERWNDEVSSSPVSVFGAGGL